MSIVVGFIPIVGSIQSVVEFGTGHDHIGGEPTSRWLAAGGIFAGVLPGGKGLLKGGSKAVTMVVRHADDVPAKQVMRAVVPKSGAVAEEGGLNLFKWKQSTSTRKTGWREGNRFLYLPNQGNAKANWAQNSTRLRQEMRNNRPIFDSHVDDAGNLIPTQGFLNAERNLLMNRGWTFNLQTGAWHPPLGP